MSLDKVNDKVKNLAATLKTGIVFDDAGVGKLADDAFEQSLAEAGLDLATVKKSQHAVLDFADGLTLALGEVGMEHLKKHGALKSVSTSVKAGLDQINIEIEKTREYRNPKDGSRGIKYGAVTASLKHGVGANRGAFKHITTDINEKYASVFSS